MNKTLRRTLPLLCCLGFLSLSTHAAQTFYKWIDEEGVTHYSAQKPHGQQADEVTIRGGRQTSQSSSQASTPANTNNQKDSSPETTSNEEEFSRKDPERCNWAKDNLATLQSYSRVRVKEDNGELRYLSDKEKQSKIRDIQKIIDEAC
ncbi:DUF4124 domain-containing protein [Aurantivibrio plasticivorans]